MVPLLVYNRRVLDLELSWVRLALLLVVPLRWSLLVIIVRMLCVWVVLLIHLRLLILHLNIPVIVRVIVALLSVLLLLRLPHLFVLVDRRRRHIDLHWHVLRGHIRSVSLILLDLVSDLGRHILEVGRKRPAIGIFVLLQGAFPGELGVVLLADLLSFGGARRGVLQDDVFLFGCHLMVRSSMGHLGVAAISLHVLLALRP